MLEGRTDMRYNEKQFTSNNVSELNSAFELHRKWVLGLKGGEKVSFSHCTFLGITFSSLNTCFVSMRMEDCTFLACKLFGFDFEHATFYRVTFENCSLRASTFKQAEFFMCSFENCNLNGNNWLLSANMEGIIKKCDLDDARFHYCNLDGTKFIENSMNKSTSFHASYIAKTQFDDPGGRKGTVLNKKNNRL